MFRSKAAVDVTRLSPLRRGFLMGYRRARHKAAQELRSVAANFDAELASLQRDYRELATEVHRARYAAAVDAAILQRATDAGIVLH